MVEQDGIKKTINDKNINDIELNNGDIVHRHLMMEILYFLIVNHHFIR